MPSSTSSARASIGNGGGSAALSTSTVQSPTSTSPVARLGLTVPSGRARTVPEMRTTYSLRRSAAPSTTHCTSPVWSRRSTKARCSPCSRRRATQPHSCTAWPMSARRSAPQYLVRMVMTGLSSGGSTEELAYVGHEIGPADAGLFTTAVTQGADRRPRRSRFVGADDDGEGRAGAVRRLHLGLHAAPVERPVRAHARRPQLRGDG